MTAPRRETRCTWIAPSEDPDARYLVPGCMERVLDWDAPCTCKSTAQELDEAEARIAQLERELDCVRDGFAALRSVVGRHSDGRTLLEQGYKLADEWMERKRRVAESERP